MPLDGLMPVGFHPETKPAHDLTSPRGRLLYLRDQVVPQISLPELRMQSWECGTKACLAGHAMRDERLRECGLVFDEYEREPFFMGRRAFVALEEFFGITQDESMHLFHPVKYGLEMVAGPWEETSQPTHAELRRHIDDVLEERFR